MKKNILPVLHIDQFEKSQVSFYTNNLVDHLKDHHFIHTPHKHDFYLVVMFTNGTGTHEVDFTRYKVKAGSVFTLLPGQTHDWKLSNDIEGYVFFHSREFYELNFTVKRPEDYLFFSSVHQSPVIHLKAKQQGYFELKFKEILNEFKNDNKMKFEKIIGLVDVLYIDLHRNFEAGSNKIHADNYLDKLRKLEDMIDKFFMEIKSPSVYADKMNMSKKHLNRICKTCLNKTTTEMISDRVILEAKRILIRPNMSVSMVATDLGYDDMAYFSRLFKKRTGKTPREFAKVYLAH